MAKLTKKRQSQTKEYDLKKSYPLTEAIKLIKESDTTKFDSAIDIALNLKIDVKNPLQTIRQAVTLPHGRGKVPRILVICGADQEAEAREAGADHVGCDDYIKKIEKGWIDIDVIVAVPALMAKLGKLGKILGPAGLMPNPKTGTVTQKVKQTVKEIKSGRIVIKTDKAGIVHSSIGRISFPVKKLEENIKEIVSTIIKSKHHTVKGEFLTKITLSSTMGPGIDVLINSVISKRTIQ